MTFVCDCECGRYANVSAGGCFSLYVFICIKCEVRKCEIDNVSTSFGKYFVKYQAMG